MKEAEIKSGITECIKNLTSVVSSVRTPFGVGEGSYKLGSPQRFPSVWLPNPPPLLCLVAREQSKGLPAL